MRSDSGYLAIDHTKLAKNTRSFQVAVPERSQSGSVAAIPMSVWGLEGATKSGRRRLPHPNSELDVRAPRVACWKHSKASNIAVRRLAVCQVATQCLNLAHGPPLAPGAPKKLSCSRSAILTTDSATDSCSTRRASLCQRAGEPASSDATELARPRCFNSSPGEIAAESGEDIPASALETWTRGTEAPGGPTKLIDFVLAADIERAQLLEAAHFEADPLKIAEIQTRLADIEAHAAPARAGVILNGLGFDARAQLRPLSEFSGGWRMRVALAAVLFSKPDLLLLDEPTNYLDLEGTLWLVDYLSRYPASAIVISHDRDLLDAVATHILHLNRGKLQLYRGNYSSFEKQRREAQELAAKAGKKQEEQRKHLQAFVDRFRAKATKARQAQSRMKLLANMQDVVAIVDDAVRRFTCPRQKSRYRRQLSCLKTPSSVMASASCCRRFSFSLSNDDRIGLLGANGNGKSTFAKLLGGRLAASAGKAIRAPQLEAGFFAQHQVDDLDLNDTPYTVFARLMPDAPQARVRAMAARVGFSGARADTKVERLSGGEKARLLLGVASFHRPHLLILDEPTNHLDIDSRAALITRDQ